MSARSFTRRLVLQALPAGAAAAALPALAQDEERDVWLDLERELAKLPLRERVERLAIEFNDALTDVAEHFDANEYQAFIVKTDVGLRMEACFATMEGEGLDRRPTFTLRWKI